MPLAARTDRQQPVGAHLQFLVQCFHGIVVEGVFLLVRVPRRPDQRFMCVGEARAAKIRHRVRFPPHHIVHDPEAEILERRANTEDVVIGADHPDRAGILQRAPRRVHPVAGERIIGLEAREFVPVVVDRVHLRLVGPGQPAAKLQIIGRIGEDEIDRFFGERIHRLDAIALDDDFRRISGLCRQRFRRRFSADAPHSNPLWNDKARIMSQGGPMVNNLFESRG